MVTKYQGILFDMDNTILSSKIDFKQMKQDCISVLEKYGMLEYLNHCKHSTTAQLLELGKEIERNKGEQGIVRDMLALIEKCERDGMKDANLENGAVTIVEQLAKEKTVIIVTNNATAPARYALEKTGILSYFNDVFGRDRLQALKPSPLSIETVLSLYPSIEKSKWVMVGDSWIDGKAANEAGIDFIAYQSNEDMLKEKKVTPIATIDHLAKLLDRN
ncbi:HAD family hydrolase [Anaerobacillus sp. MEB173]|uniref:HAD family hydrolase n=1 Tax=Anaerobacillus sp. MEB173 TaxID=3383345 RepID=UPI003F91CF5F